MFSAALNFHLRLRCSPVLTHGGEWSLRNSIRSQLDQDSERWDRFSRLVSPSVAPHLSVSRVEQSHAALEHVNIGHRNKIRCNCPVIHAEITRENFVL